MWKVHVTHDREHGCQDNLHSTEVAQLYPQVGDFITSYATKSTSILSNVHFLWCMARRSPHSLSQHFPAPKHPHLGFTTADYTILQIPLLMPWWGVHRTSPKVRITPSFPCVKNICKTRKSTCYSTKPTHINPMLRVVNIVTRSMNRSLGSQAGTTTTKNGT
jgi:hypothetical protein